MKRTFSYLNCKLNFTFSNKVFNETNVKDNTGMRVAVCPCDASSWNVTSSHKKNKQTLKYSRCRIIIKQTDKSIYLNVRINSRLPISWLL